MNLKRFLPFAIVLAATFVAGVLFATLGSNLINQGNRVGSDLNAYAPEIIRGTELAPQVTLEETFINVTAIVSPAVVQITSQQEMTVPPSARQFFDDQAIPFNIPRRGLGSGVIIRSDGYIVTNNHVIAEANRLQVMLHDGSVEKAQVVGADSSSDLAVIKIDRDNLPSVPLGLADELRVGQWVLAFGSPLSQALENTVTAGIVSALNRSSAQLTQMNLYSAFIQTDAAINRGNSGGPLVNLKGQLIGINTAILSPTGLNSGIGFAIPVDVVDNVVTQLIDNGHVERGYLGILFGSVSQALSDALGVSPGAAQITAVMPGSAADNAGLETGQIITKVNDVTLTEHNQLRILIGNMKPGDEVSLTVVDGEQSNVYTIRLGWLDLDRLAGNEAGEDNRDSPADNLRELGLTLQTFDAQAFVRQTELEDVPDFEGILVESVNPSGTAYSESAFVRETSLWNLTGNPSLTSGNSSAPTIGLTVAARQSLACAASPRCLMAAENS